MTHISFARHRLAKLDFNHNSMESSESQSPNLSLIGKKLTERSSTDIFGKLFGHEMRISSPVWLPEAWKNKIVDEMRGKFQRAFPGIDFSRVSSKELNNIGFQTVFAETPQEKEDKRTEPGVALLESMTQITATYAYLLDKHKSIELKDLEHSGMIYSGSPNVDRITKSLMRTLWQYHAHHVDELPPFDGSKLDQYMHESVQVIARALFSGNYQELKMKYSENPRGHSFDELLTYSIESKFDPKKDPTATPESESKTGRARIEWDTLGMYTENKTRNQNQIVYNATGLSFVSAMRPLVDLLGILSPKNARIRITNEHEWIDSKDAANAMSIFIRTINLHEFTHFFSFRLWSKQPPETLDPSLHHFLH